MGQWARTGRFGRAVALIGVGLAGGGAALAVASVPDSSGVIHACYSVDGSGSPVTGAPNLTVFDPSAGQTCNTSPVAGRPGQRALEWNVAGPPGAQGPPGPPGDPGRAATVIQGQTLTLSGGQVLTVQSPPGGVTIQQPSAGRGFVASVVLNTGGQPLSFSIRGYSFGTSNGQGGAGAIGKQTHEPIVITKSVDKSSSMLALYCATGRHFSKGTITLRKAGGTGKGAGKPYLVYKFGTVFVNAIQTNSPQGKGSPVETVSLDVSSLAVNHP